MYALHYSYTHRTRHTTPRHDVRRYIPHALYTASTSHPLLPYTLRQDSLYPTEFHMQLPHSPGLKETMKRRGYQNAANEPYIIRHGIITNKQK